MNKISKIILIIIFISISSLFCKVKDMTIIKKIIIEDSNTVSLRKIKRESLLPSSFPESKTDFIKKKIISGYNKLGYIEAVITKIDLSPPSEKRVLKAWIIPGVKLLIGKVNIISLPVLIKQQKLRIEMIKSGDPFDIDKINKLRIDISEAYSNIGYLYAIIDIQLMRINDNIIDVNISAAPGERIRIGKIIIRGNKSFPENFISKQLFFKSGDMYSTRMLKLSRDYLLNTGYFRTINFIHSRFSEKPNPIDLYVEVIERPPRTIETGGGYDNLDNFRIFGLWKHKNINKRGGQLKLIEELSEKRFSSSIELSQIFLKHKPFIFNIEANGYREKYIAFVEKTYNLDFSILRFIKPEIQIKYYSSVKITELENLDPQNPPELLVDKFGSLLLSSAGIRIDVDKAYPLNEPRFGWKGYLNCQLTGSLLGGDKNLYKVETFFSKYYQINRKSLFVGKIKSGVVKEIIDTKEVPLSERFFAGGPGTIRGFKEQTVGIYNNLGEPIGGKVMFFINFDYLIRIQKSLFFGLFFDAGNNWDELSLQKIKHIRFGTGYGFSYKLPAGIIKIEMGHNPDRKKNEEPYRLHLQIGSSF